MIRRLVLVCCLLLLPLPAGAYPMDGFPDTGIRRVEGARLANEGIIPGRRQPDGAQLSTAEVDLRLLDHRSMDLPPPDPVLTAQVRALLGRVADRYGIAVLDLSDPDRPRYAEHRGRQRQNISSVGKLVVALGLFQALADAWPDDLDRRREILKNTQITADEFCRWDVHKIRFFDVENREERRRPLQDGDRGSLWEYLDWTLSASSNAAAAMVMRDAMLLRHFGTDYPLPEAAIRRFFLETSRQELTALFRQTFFDPVSRNGLDIQQLRQGSFFTRVGKQKVSGAAGSYGTARALMEFALRMEQGRLVDEFSSREIKRLLYVTERRIRYAASPALRDSAVYFKSGSMYSCTEEPGYRCGRYLGNEKNYMNSVAIVETATGQQRLHYIVVLISNVLRRNSVVDHQNLATEIHRLMEQAHPATAPVPAK